jgi:DNA mismatch repair protein MutL
MNRIRLLPEQVANQIAAGEVVERPASVVKELVENALDAQATSIIVEIQAGGRSLIRVSDDGVGMSKDDALLCLERHATSKIRLAEDLSAVMTLGFRGEALPSIASVSRFSLTTRERDNPSPEGTQVVVNGGRIVEVKAAGCAPGTVIEARQLFFNLPARRKFLRSEETESAHIQHYLTLAALAFPEVAFTYQKDGRLVWLLPAVRVGTDPAGRRASLRERLKGLHGEELKLLPVEFQSRFSAAANPIDEEFGAPEPSPDFRVWGFIGAPGVSRATREDQHLFVNRRPVENRGLNYALLEGYHTALMKGRYPVCCLFIEIDPAAVDVNIHPAKREIKFHREMEVRRLVSQGVRQALLQFAQGSGPGVVSPGAAVPERSSGPSSPPTHPVPATGLTTGQTALPGFPPPKPAEPEVPVPVQPALPMGFIGAARSVFVPPPAPAAPPTQAPAVAPAPQAPESSAGKPAVRSGEPVPFLNIPLRLIGVVGRLYVLLESDEGLVLLDQHAAHERILFEQMLARLEQHQQAPQQKLLLPETIELSPRDATFLREQLPALTRLGVGLSEFGERTFLLDALPPFVHAVAPRTFVLELVDQLRAAGQEVNSVRLGEHVVAKTVCRHAVKANDPLAGKELENLIDDLRRCAMPYTCPHGRPTMIEMKYRELEKKFGRAQ